MKIVRVLTNIRLVQPVIPTLIVCASCANCATVQSSIVTLIFAAMFKARQCLQTS